MRLHIHSRKRCEEEATKVIASSLRSVIRRKGSAVLAVPGGRSVSRVFKLLSSAKVNWSKVHIFMVDERLVKLGHKNSNFNIVEGGLLIGFLKHYKIHLENIHPFMLTKGKDYGLAKYTKELKNVGGNFDVVLLSSGEDGHIGALYPNHASVRSNAKYFISMTNSPKLPRKRMTMSRNLLLGADTAVVLFFGKGKKKALKKFLDLELGPEDCPAKLIYAVKKSFAFSDIK